MIDSPTVTVIIPVYNAGGYLRDAVTSILNQTFTDFECLIIDDGSTDGCMDSLGDLTDPRLRIFRQENQGKPAVMNRAIAMARGEFYAIQDADDWSYPTRMERLVACMRTHSHIAAAFSCYDLLLDGRRTAQRSREKDETACRRDIDTFRMPSHDPTAMYRLSLVRDVRYSTDLPVGQGYDYILRVGEKFPIRVVADCLYSYRIHANSITRRRSDRAAFVRLAVQRACERRGIAYEREFPPASESRRHRNAHADNNLVAHFVESVLDYKRRSRRAAALATAARCMALHPADPYYYRPLAWVCVPTCWAERYRLRRQVQRAPRQSLSGNTIVASGDAVRVLYSYPHVLGKGGIGTTAWHQVQGLIDAGAEVHVVCSACARPVSGAASLRESLTVGGVRIPRRAIGPDRAWHLHDWLCSRSLSRHSGEYDVVHCWPSGALFTLRAAARQGVVSYLERPSAHTRYVHEKVRQESERLGIAVPRSHYSGVAGSRLAREEAEFELAEFLLCPSKFVGETFRRYGHSADRLRYHHYGFDPKRFFPDATARSRERFTALYCGEGIALKGLHIALDAWFRSGVAETGRMLIAGAIMPSLARVLHEQLGHSSVEVLGFRRDVPDLMRASDVLLLPSFAEGSALVTYEARASGCILLASDAAGARCTHMQTGLIHSAGDVDALSEHLRLIANDGALRARLREASLDEIGDWSWRNAGERLLQIYADERYPRSATEASHALVHRKPQAV